MPEIYSYLVASIILLWLIHKNVFPKNPLLYCISVGIIMFIVLGFRSADIGVDLGRYSSHYEYIYGEMDFDKSLFYKDLNPAFWALNYFLSSLNLPFQGFMIIVSAICVSSFVFFIYRNTSNPMLAFLGMLGLGYYTFLFSGLKQSLAMSVALLFFDAQMRGKMKLSISWLILSILFHWASIVLIPLFFVGRLKMTKTLGGCYLAILIAMIIFSQRFGETITLLLVESYAGHYESSGRIGGTAIFSLFILLSYLTLVYNKKIALDTYILHGLIILCMIQICASYAYAFTRINLYYMSGIMTVAVSMIGNKKNLKVKYKTIGTKNFITISFGLAWMIVMIYLFFVHVNGELSNDYKFYWQ